MDPSSFQKKILSFYRRQGRRLPWRETTDPYSILISEVMLQQTQVDRVIPYYTRWLDRWPKVQLLAEAERFDVLKEWSGLGYNSRALRLQESARVISEQFKGDVLAALKDYRQLPGIGPYTSRAVEIFSANHDLVTVDTNIRRIFIHEFRLPAETSDKEIWSLAEACLPRGQSRDWHNALMDYGSLVLTSKKTGITPRFRQSRFEGSDRQIRASILRNLLSRGKGATISLDELASHYGEQRRAESILAGMVKDKLVRPKKGRYQVA